MQARLNCLATQKLPAGNSALPNIQDVKLDVSALWWIDNDGTGHINLLSQ